MQEREIWAGCIQGKQECQRELFAQYAGKLKATLLRYIKDDARANKILVDLFTDIFRKITRGEWRENVPFEVWTKSLVMNYCLMYVRKKRVFFLFKPVHEEVQVSNINMEELEPVMSAKNISEVLYKIPDPHRVLFNLYVVDGYSEADIASSVSVKPEWVSRGIKEAREMVHRELQKKVRLTYASAL